MTAPLRFRDRAVIVTGAASGIGRAAALAYAREGAAVTLGDIDAAGAQAVADAIAAEGGRALFVAADVTRADQVEALVAAAVARFGRLDTIFASAGVYPAEDAVILDVDPAVFWSIIDVNLKGMFHAARYALPHLQKTGGSVVLTSAQAAFTGAATTGFTASAGGVIAFMRSIAYQYGPLGVRANAVVPAFIDTPMVRATRAAHGLPPRATGATTLLGRPGTPEDAAQLALFLSSDDASYITGAAMTVDGGPAFDVLVGAAARGSHLLRSAAPMISDNALAADAWPGNTLLAGGKGYVATPMGQVHYRDIGPRSDKPVFLLLHQSQMSILQYADIQPALAVLGYRSVAVDAPGHGMSDAPPYQPTVPQFADNLIPVLDQLGVGRAVVAGHHSGTAVAAAFAVRHSERVAALVLHGSVIFDAQERAERLATPQWDRTPRADGSHMGAWFRPFAGDLTDDPATLRSRTWMMMSLFMMGPDIGKPAVYGYDMAADVPHIAAPTLLLTDEADSVHPFDERIAALRPDFTYRVFSASGPMTMTNEPRRWAAVVADYVGDLSR